MRSEASGARIGRLTIADVRAGLGRDVDILDAVVVCVVAECGPPFFGVVHLVDKKSSPDLHRALECSGCGRACRLLVARHGRLACRACLRHRPRRSHERHLRSWNRLGGKEEDALVRMLSRQHRNEVVLQQARSIARSLLQSDNDRAFAAGEIARNTIMVIDENA